MEGDLYLVIKNGLKESLLHDAMGPDHRPVDRMRDTAEDITFPQTCAGSKNHYRLEIIGLIRVFRKFAFENKWKKIKENPNVWIDLRGIWIQYNLY